MTQQLELRPGETKSIEDIVAFVKMTSKDMSPNGREALVISIFREFREEVDRVRARNQKS